MAKSKTELMLSTRSQFYAYKSHAKSGIQGVTSFPVAILTFSLQAKISHYLLCRTFNVFKYVFCSSVIL